jgi:hypothetical protein
LASLHFPASNSSWASFSCKQQQLDAEVAGKNIQHMHACLAQEVIA